MGTALILLVEGTRAKRTSFADSLKKHYDVASVASGKQAIQYAAKNPPQVIVLDAISMRTPGDRIVDLLKSKLPNIPLIHLHPGKKPQTTQADSVITQPFTSRKLLNNIRRVYSPNETAPITSGPFSIHLDRRVLIVNGQDIRITPKVAKLVEMFLRNPGQTLDRKTLMEHVWETDYLGDTRTLDVHIRWIRRAIEPNPSKPQYLKTVRGIGYRLDLPTKAASKTDRTAS